MVFEAVFRWAGPAARALQSPPAAAVAGRWAVGVPALAVAIVAMGLMAVPPPLGAQGAGKAGPGIYTCLDGQGRKLTSDRPIPECAGREQRLLNSDGSLRAVVPPTLTNEERAARDAKQRRQEQERAAQADAVRRDRNLVSRYPNEAAHARARQSALETVRVASKAGEQRLAALAAERRKLDDEAEFYKGRTLPATLKQQLDANDAVAEAQRQAAKSQEAELKRVNAKYDSELEHLRKLWAGASPGAQPMAGAVPAPGAAAAPTTMVPAADMPGSGPRPTPKR